MAPCLYFQFAGRILGRSSTLHQSFLGTHLIKFEPKSTKFTENSRRGQGPEMMMITIMMVIRTIAIIIIIIIIIITLTITPTLAIPIPTTITMKMIPR